MPNPRTGPAGTFPGTTMSGGLNMRRRTPFNDLVRVIDENGNVRVPDLLTTQYYPKSLPAPSNGKPTYAQCQALVARISATLAQKVLQQSQILRFVYRGTFYGNLQTASVVLGPNTVTLNQYETYSEAVPVDVLLNNPRLIDDLASRMAGSLAQFLDSYIVELYSWFTTNTAVGTAATPLTAAVINSAIADLVGLNEPIFVAIHPVELGLGNILGGGVSIAAGLPLDPIPFYQGTNYANVGSGKTWADVAAIAGQAANTAPAAWLIACPNVAQTGSGTKTLHNLAFTPSAFQVASIQVPLVNDGVNAQALSVFEGLALTVFVNNTGSGPQAAYAAFAGGVSYTSANGVAVIS